MARFRPLRMSYLIIARTTSQYFSSVFKPKDEEPYGRLNPKVCDAKASRRIGLRVIILIDDQMATPTVQVDNTIRKSMFNT